MRRVRDDVLHWNLKRRGATFSKQGTPGVVLSLEETLARALDFSRRDPCVAQVWPVVFARNRAAVDVSRLVLLAVEMGQGRALGFLLSVTAWLLGDPTLRCFDVALKDGAPREAENFFLDVGENWRYRELAERNTPEEAREWGFRMNTSLEDFKSHFDKFVRPHEALHK